MLKTLSVLVNPYAHLDHLGRAAGSCPKEAPLDGRPLKAWVGAEVKATMLETFPRGSTQSDMQDTWFVFTRDPVTVPNTQYYRERIRYGDLFAADAKTAAECGRKFADPKQLLADSKARALADWEAQGRDFPPACLDDSHWADAAKPAAAPAAALEHT